MCLHICVCWCTHCNTEFGEIMPLLKSRRASFYFWQHVHVFHFARLYSHSVSNRTPAKCLKHNVCVCVRALVRVCFGGTSRGCILSPGSLARRRRPGCPSQSLLSTSLCHLHVVQEEIIRGISACHC